MRLKLAETGKIPVLTIAPVLRLILSQFQTLKNKSNMNIYLRNKGP
jgi:hypothetical protein